MKKRIFTLFCLIALFIVGSTTANALTSDGAVWVELPTTEGGAGGGETTGVAPTPVDPAPSKPTASRPGGFLPNTGGAGSIMLTALGIVLLGILPFLLWKKRRKQAIKASAMIVLLFAPLRFFAYAHAQTASETGEGQIGFSSVEIIEEEETEPTPPPPPSGLLELVATPIFYFDDQSIDDAGNLYFYGHKHYENEPGNGRHNFVRLVDTRVGNVTPWTLSVQMDGQWVHANEPHTLNGVEMTLSNIFVNGIDPAGNPTGDPILRSGAVVIGQGAPQNVVTIDPIHRGYFEVNFGGQLAPRQQDNTPLALQSLPHNFFDAHAVDQAQQQAYNNRAMQLRIPAQPGITAGAYRTRFTWSLSAAP